jgi:hypothetical protein
MTAFGAKRTLGGRSRSARIAWHTVEITFVENRGLTCLPEIRPGNRPPRARVNPNRNCIASGPWIRRDHEYKPAFALTNSSPFRVIGRAGGIGWSRACFLGYSHSRRTVNLSLHRGCRRKNQRDSEGKPPHGGILLPDPRSRKKGIWNVAAYAGASLHYAKNTPSYCVT